MTTTQTLRMHLAAAATAASATGNGEGQAHAAAIAGVFGVAAPVLDVSAFTSALPPHRRSLPKLHFTLAPTAA